MKAFLERGIIPADEHNETVASFLHSISNFKDF